MQKSIIHKPKVMSKKSKHTTRVIHLIGKEERKKQKNYKKIEEKSHNCCNKSLSTITLNLNWLNSLIKRHRMDE
jgi:hypothetical protein